MELAPGAFVMADVRLIRPLSEGAMGSIWVADQLSSGRQVAVKFIHSKHASDRATLARFEREAKAASRIRSPHVVEILAHGTSDGTPYIVMELLSGESLGDRLERMGSLSYDDAAAVLAQVGKALDIAHGLEIIHRDIKPDNVYLVGDDDYPLVKVLDFGMAKEIRERSQSIVTATGVSVGTPDYMSPEQVLGSKEVDYRSDLWSLGVMLYRCIAGVIPFQGTTPHALFFAICKGEFAPLEQSNTPKVFEPWFRRALAPKKQNRFRSAQEMVDDFGRVVQSLSTRRGAPLIGDEATEFFTLPDLATAASEERTERQARGDYAPSSGPQAAPPSGPTSASWSNQSATQAFDLDDESELEQTTALEPGMAAAIMDAALARTGGIPNPPASAPLALSSRRPDNQPDPASVSGGYAAASGGYAAVSGGFPAVPSTPGSRPGFDEEMPPSSRGPMSRPVPLMAGRPPVAPPPSARTPLTSYSDAEHGAPNSGRLSHGGGSSMGGAPTKRWPAVLIVLVVLVVGGLAVSQVTGGKAESKPAPAQPSAQPRPPEHLEQELPAPDPGDLDEIVEPSTEGKGLLTIQCVPKCRQIWFNKKMLGGSPLEKQVMEPGVHLLTLVHKGGQKIVRVTIKEGEETTRKVFLTQ